MNLQYISDSTGKTTGVFIPINEWNELIKKFKGIELEDFLIPEWHKKIVRSRLAQHKENPDKAVDFDQAMDEIEKDI